MEHPRSSGRAEVVSILGPGRSGTTLLGSIVGELPGSFYAGEVRWLWERGLLGDRPCGCGAPLVECEVWAPALDLTSRRTGVSVSDAEAVVGWQRELGAVRNRARVLRLDKPGQPTGWEALDRYTGLLAGVYSALAEVTGAATIVDTSKRAHDAAVIERIPTLGHRVISVIRDPRAVAYSWTRVKPVPTISGSTEMARRGPVRSAGRWLENSLGVERLRGQVPANRWFSLRYEDFARSPADISRQLTEFLGADGTASPVHPDRSVVLSPNHTVAGNPDRFRSGPTVIREDAEWRGSLNRRDAAIVAALTSPLLPRYGYRLSPGRTGR